MSTLMRFDPFRDFDRLAEQMMLGGGRGGPRSFPMDAYRRGDRFFVHLDLPGVQTDSIELTAEQNVPTIRAERRYELEESDELIVPSARRASTTASYSSVMPSTPTG